MGLPNDLLKTQEDLDESLKCYSIESVSDLWGCSPGHVRTQIRSGKLPTIKIGRRVLIRRSDALRHLEENVVETAAA